MHRKSINAQLKKKKKKKKKKKHFQGQMSKSMLYDSRNLKNIKNSNNNKSKNLPTWLHRQVATVRSSHE